ncbi:MAG: hypothetical protein IJ833_09475 [Lachnospiraceae bacterium]|nr:hypothetical protein [Lachnospiraceae bacterium]
MAMNKKAKVHLEKQYKRQNEHIKEKYDRISITLPKGTKERIKAKGETVNGYITRLVLADLGEKQGAEPEPVVAVHRSSDFPDVPFL